MTNWSEIINNIYIFLIMIISCKSYLCDHSYVIVIGHLIILLFKEESFSFYSNRLIKLVVNYSRFLLEIPKNLPKKLECLLVITIIGIYIFKSPQQYVSQLIFHEYWQFNFALNWRLYNIEWFLLKLIGLISNVWVTNIKINLI